MRASFAFAFGFALLVGCAPGSETPQYTTDGGLPGPIGGGGGTLGDGGADAGDAGTDAGADSGFVTDGGCAGAFARPVAQAVDYCNSTTGFLTTASLTGNCDSAQLTAGSIVCTGQLTGPFDAFDGGCNVLGGSALCAATSLPGRVDCTAPTVPGCYFIVCGPGPDAGCGP